MSYQLLHGDCLDKLKDLGDNSVHAIVTDPPYGLTQNKKGGSGVASASTDTPYGRARIGTGNGAGGFMGMKWDSSVPPVEMWRECLRVLKPGGHLLSFAGSRTYHRLVVNVEDAGFEIRDQIMWVYGSGFPKSHNIGHKAEEWVGWGSALKPAHEPIVVARKPLIGTIVENVLEHGTGGLNIDESRIKAGEDHAKNTNRKSVKGHWGASEGAEIVAHEAGRYPANFIHDGSDEVVSLFPDRKTTWVSPSHQNNREGGFMGALGHPQNQGFNDEGSAARFFYCAKASKAERNAGVDQKNIHPTVKPVDLMKYLCRLITPPNGIVLDPFMGSGTTGIAATTQGFGFIGIEMNEEYILIARDRIKHWTDEYEEVIIEQRKQNTLEQWGVKI